ncbi:TIGR03087 family PEP-CTERM/XrtA system glycosyltransferase [Novosphingobium decolorationis]|uniref:TIGR03087 family PEP-CTERM/XrtA system glycosyltransferase n=1 Tax=Novosphingobium decolorationis TaxID=2698673 RepID=A0ABX8DZX2_9SPHN|nr:TIGR03087 family PEP-CTERM/XrtA system glycosyltransferase [Novosphingobium decolorationis]QVM82427.1 TIGR03087 family PEP-CTERM/XrtA system glycosyltransferase [Novosphingobium decolorationis]
MRGEILFLAHRLPFPPDRGDKIRSHHVLKALARFAPVHVATFADDPADWDHEKELAALAASHCLLPRTKSVPRAALEALALGVPVSLRAFHDPRLAAYVDRVLAHANIAVIFVFSGQMAQYVPDGFAGRVVTDLVDVDSAKFEAYAQDHKGPRRWMEWREARLLAAEEARIAARSDATLLVSEAEAELLRTCLLQPSARVASMGNGIDAQTFAPDVVEAEPRMRAAGFPRLVFTGQMDYAPNIAAVERATHQILPRVQEHFPQASLHIVGRNPTREVLALGQEEGVTVWGRVPDVRPFLEAADMALVPLSIARGVQNKVLEAMAMTRPVVLTSGAATGIAARDGVDFRVGDTDEDLAAAIVHLATQPDIRREMGMTARAWVCQHASWEAALSGLEGLCVGGCDA